ncbi:MAG TPA: DUF4124 domain-containing protein [Steroidobacteraceae bacterium]|nr:DUF4124 domain-containing protein [Steroidobacteraceae bacterium]
MRGLPLLLMLGACAGAWSATVYKWVDDEGVTHFSDQPNPKAQKLQVSGAQTYGAQAAAAPPPVAAAPPAAAPAVCVIDTPSAGQVFLDTYTVSGHVTLAHAGDGAQSTLRMDGVDISSLLAPGGTFTLSQVDRGDHTLTLQVTNARGEVTCDATPVTFSIRQRSSAANTVPMAPTVPAAPKVPGVGRP